jgi:hypothetical protein
VTTDGKSTVVSDTTIPVADVLGMVDFWFTDQVPASLAAQGAAGRSADPAAAAKIRHDLPPV